MTDSPDSDQDLLSNTLEEVLNDLLRAAPPLALWSFSEINSEVKALKFITPTTVKEAILDYGFIELDDVTRPALHEALTGFHLLVKEGSATQFIKFETEEDLIQRFFDARTALLEWSQAVSVGEAEPPE
jgi:hypothetical protein